jgi:hypothetical protein
MNFLIPLGAIAGGVLGGLKTVHKQQEEERLRKQQEFTRALDALMHVMTSPQATPETLEYMTKVLGPVFQKQGVTLPQLPPIKPKATQDFENMLRVIKMADEKLKAGEITQEERDAIVYGKPYESKRERVIAVPFGDQMLELTVPEAELFKQVMANLRQQEKLAARGGGRGGGRTKVEKLRTPTGILAKTLEEAQSKFDSGDLESGRALIEQYNAMASQLRMPQYEVVGKKIKGRDKYFLQPKGTAPPPQAVDISEQLKKLGIKRYRILK